MNEHVKEVAKGLEKFIKSEDKSIFNYERSVLIDKAPYLDAFVENREFPPFEIEIQMSSKCNLKCRWCIGDVVQSQKQVLGLPNNINEKNIDSIINGIKECNIGGLKIDMVKFSGFIGEPLFNQTKGATMKAIKRLVGCGFKVGLFTNGILMEDDTWDSLVNIKYVHISLDAGPSSFYWLKDPQSEPFNNKNFYKIIENIKGLNIKRKEKGTKLEINIGYVIIPGNHNEIYEVANIVKEAGADSIRFKCDIGGVYNLEDEILEKALNQIERVKNELDDKSFSVYSIHTKQEITEHTYKSWKCEDGCYYQHFLGTIGSDGNLYLCDHNSMPGAISLGMILDKPFKEIWQSERRKYLTDGVKYTCQSFVCPPFGNRINFFLKTIKELSNEYGIANVKGALELLREKYK